MRRERERGCLMMWYVDEKKDGGCVECPSVNGAMPV